MLGHDSLPLSHCICNLQKNLALALSTHTRDNESSLEGSFGLSEVTPQNVFDLTEDVFSTGKQIVNGTSHGPVNVASHFVRTCLGQFEKERTVETFNTH
jgi:hypothetical protein